MPLLKLFIIPHAHTVPKQLPEPSDSIMPGESSIRARHLRTEAVDALVPRAATILAIDTHAHHHQLPPTALFAITATTSLLPGALPAAQRDAKSHLPAEVSAALPTRAISERQDRAHGPTVPGTVRFKPRRLQQEY